MFDEKIDTWVWNEKCPISVSYADWLTTLYTVFIAASNSIFEATLCADGDIIIVGKHVASLIKGLTDFKALLDKEIFNSISDKKFLLGRLSDRWDIYLDTSMKDNIFSITYSGIDNVSENYRSACVVYGKVV